MDVHVCVGVWLSTVAVNKKFTFRFRCTIVLPFDRS